MKLGFAEEEEEERGRSGIFGFNGLNRMVFYVQGNVRRAVKEERRY